VQFIAARFPYIFVDEFQDTQPAQTELLLKFAAHGTVVGVIGDVEQSIYAFINARPRDFYEIPLQGIVDYAISMNQRSSGEIVRFLNAVRKDDLVQQSVKGENGVAVKVIHGDLKNMVDYVRSQNGAYSPVFLTRTNARVAELRQIDNGHIVREVWDECEECDLLRYRFLRRLLQASEFIRNDQMSYGVKRALEALSFHRSSIGRLFTQQGPVTKLTCQGIAVALLECDLMLDDSVTLFDAYAEYSSVFNRHSIRIPAITRGKFREFAEGISLGNLRSALDTPDAKTEFRTIHSAKGAEFDTVGLFLFENNSLDKCLDPDVINERLRLAYVGMSRAKSHLIVCLAHEPHESLCSKIKALGAQVYEV
jgi:DNA helicase-2/ATP-dependent DNA helicase PcrA